MRKRKMLILPKLYDAGGDMSKGWFVYFSVRNPRSEKLERKKVYRGLKVKNKKKRYKAAEDLIQELEVKLRAGWNPFVNDESVIYEDNLEYRNITKTYKILRATNKDIHYYASRFIEDIAVRGAASVAMHQSKLRQFSAWIKTTQGEIDVAAIDNEMIIKFFKFIISAKNLSERTVSAYRQAICRLFDFVRKERPELENPVYNTPHGIDKDLSPRPISNIDIEEFREVISKEDEQLWLAIEFITYCFLRPGKELRLMQIHDIDFARGLINVDRIRAKTNRQRYITIPGHFLKKLRNVYHLHRLPGDYYVFSQNGAPGKILLGKNNMRYRFNRFREQLNMPDTYKFYSWKHTGNSLAVDSQISMYALRDQNGHTSVQTTEGYLKNKIGAVSQEIRTKFPNLDNV